MAFFKEILLAISIKPSLLALACILIFTQRLGWITLSVLTLNFSSRVRNLRRRTPFEVILKFVDGDILPALLTVLQRNLFFYILTIFVFIFILWWILINLGDSFFLYLSPFLSGFFSSLRLFHFWRCDSDFFRTSRLRRRHRCLPLLRRFRFVGRFLQSFRSLFTSRWPTGWVKLVFLCILCGHCCCETLFRKLFWIEGLCVFRIIESTHGRLNWLKLH